MSLDRAKLYVRNGYPKPDTVSIFRWKAIVLYFQTNGFLD